MIYVRKNALKNGGWDGVGWNGYLRVIQAQLLKEDDTHYMIDSVQGIDCQYHTMTRSLFERTYERLTIELWEKISDQLMNDLKFANEGSE